MRWTKDHVDLLLALRELVCKDRWQDGRSQIVVYQQNQRHLFEGTVAGRKRRDARQSTPQIRQVESGRAASRRKDRG